VKLQDDKSIKDIGPNCQGTMQIGRTVEIVVVALCSGERVMLEKPSRNSLRINVDHTNLFFCTPSSSSS